MGISEDFGIRILNENFEDLAIIDAFESFIWTDRYNGYGDFEFYAIVTLDIIQKLIMGYYVWSPQSEHLMIIEEREIATSVDEGNHITVRGRSLESLLTRRIVWEQTNVEGNLQSGIKRILDDSAINPIDSNRQIPGLRFEFSTDPTVTNLNLSRQFTGDNVYEAIVLICDERSLGFKMGLNPDNSIIFKLYNGVDRSYNQVINPYVIFSGDYDNIRNSNYLENDMEFKNVALVAGEGEGSTRTKVEVGSGVGFKRRELWVDARDLSRDTGERDENNDPILISPTKYRALLTQRGNENLAENKRITAFEGEVETTQMFVYERDFFLGDIIQIANEYGIQASSRISEIIFSHDQEGSLIIPTFTTLE